ncbi:MAG: rhodanese-like domain-containing protein, partial [Balneolaceae bacterium]
LDVRNITEYQQGHVEGAIQIAYTRLLERTEELPMEKPIYLYCQSGARSATATALLKRQGFDVVLIDDEFSEEDRLKTV